MITRPAAIAGPWEISDGTAIDGIFLSIYTYFTDAPRMIREQRVNIRVYHREYARRETGGWFTTSADGGATFDGRRLVIRHDFVLELTLSDDGTRWTGAWTRGNDTRKVVLERPHPAGGAVDPFVGDWDGIPRLDFSDTHTRFHVAQSVDSIRTAWMDREFRDSERHGELLEVMRSQPSTLMLDTTNPGGARFRYTGTLSGDGNMLQGSWGMPGASPETAASSMRLNASDTFRRRR